MRSNPLSLVGTPTLILMATVALAAGSSVAGCSNDTAGHGQDGGFQSDDSATNEPDGAVPDVDAGTLYLQEDEICFKGGRVWILIRKHQ